MAQVEEVEVAPSRARGLKLPNIVLLVEIFCRAFTGAWIETTNVVRGFRRLAVVAPSRARGLKLIYHILHGRWTHVAPSRARGLKQFHPA